MISNQSDCLFCRIATKNLPAQLVYEDEDALAFHDIHPKAPVHLLLILKKHLATLADADAEEAALLGKLMLLAPKLAAEHGLHDGFKLAVNVGHGGGQEVFHLHLHILGTPSLGSA